MDIEINGDTEKLIQAELASGKFHTPEEAIAAMVRAWVESQAPEVHEVSRLSPRTDIVALAARQGVKPFDPTAKVPDFWPPDESADELLRFLHGVRRDDVATLKP